MSAFQLYADDWKEIMYADPTIFVENGKYYLTGTRNQEPQGFAILESTDLEHWRSVIEMWLAQSMKQAVPTADADQGISTIVGDQMGVVTRGEVRQLPIYGPGGYVWLPESGASVLVIKGGPGGEEQCVCGGKQAEVPKGMQPGEVYIYGPKGSNVYLQKDGTIELTGRISIRGQLLINGQPYKPCTCGEGGIL